MRIGGNVLKNKPEIFAENLQKNTYKTLYWLVKGSTFNSI